MNSFQKRARHAVPLLLFFVLVLILLALPFLAAAEEKRFTVPLEDSPSCGDSNAKVTIIEFLDYQ